MPSCLSVALSQGPRRGVGFSLARADRGLVGTPVEVRSAFARLVRDGRLTSPQRATAVRLLDQLRRSWDEILPTQAVA